MPKLWSDTIEAHRRDVRAAILDTTAALVAERGLLSVTMSLIAESTGIGRATLYKYFPDVETILFAWHEQRIAAHLHHLREVRDRSDDAHARLVTVLEAFALIDHQHHGSHGDRPHLKDPVLAAVLHQGGHVDRARDELSSMLSELIDEAAQAGIIRHDIVPGELASFCIHALGAASSLPSKASVRRLVALTMQGMTPAR